jgi:glycosyltransferase involved in cell wall biosynthesis
MKKIAIVTNISWNIYNFRIDLVRAIKKAGYQPVLIAATDKYAKLLIEDGWTFIPVDNMERTGTNPFKDMVTFFDLLRIYRSHKIDLALHYHSKPLIYGNLAATLLKIPFIPTITGKGGPFSDDRKIIKLLVSFLYRLSFRKSAKVVFQNNEDMDFFVEEGITKRAKAELAEGSGIDLIKFDADRYTKPDNEKVVFFMYSRLTHAKGVTFYVDAAKKITKKYKNVEFKLAGTFESDRLAIKKEDMALWHKQGHINYIGVTTDMPLELSRSHVIVLPSYYSEGLPKSLIEAAAMSKPIITTNNVGCRQAVQHNVNGYLVPVKDSDKLAEAFEDFINLSDDEKKAMGAASRKAAETRFDKKIVVQKYMSLINNILQ